MSQTMSRNEERATEAWRAAILTQLAVIDQATQQIEDALWDAGDPAAAIAKAGERIMEAEQAIFRLRDGPERPE